MHTPNEHNPGHCPPLLMLAGYFDGRLSEDEADRVALHLSRCGECLAAIRDLRSAPTEGDPNMMFVPAHVTARAQALVERQVIASPFAIWMRRSAGLAAAVAIGVFGHAVGASFSDSPQAAADLNDEMLFGVFETSSLSEGEFFAIAVGNLNAEEAKQ